MNSDFTFGLLTYNQEKEVCSTLNSIRFQIEHYGNGRRFGLVITDDYSKDATSVAIDQWLTEYSHLFCKVILRYNKKNVGVVDNYLYILDQIDAEPFKIIAGDDLFSSQSIFEEAQNLASHSLFCGMRFFFSGTDVYLEKKWIQLQFWLTKKHFGRERILKLFRRGFIISTPQVLYSKKLFLDSHSSDYVTKFRLFEDNPTWYSMLKNVGDLDVVFSPQNIVLYRISENSISNKKVLKNTPFSLELSKLHNDYLEGAENWFEKLFVKSMIKQAPKPIRFSLYVNKIVFLKAKLYCLLHKGEYKGFEKEINEKLLQEDLHLKQILAMTEEKV